MEKFHLGRCCSWFCALCKFGFWNFTKLCEEVREASYETPARTGGDLPSSPKLAVKTGAQQLQEPWFTNYCSFWVGLPYSCNSTSGPPTSPEEDEDEQRKAVHQVVHWDSRSSALGDGNGLILTPGAQSRSDNCLWQGRQLYPWIIPETATSLREEAHWLILLRVNGCLTS